MSAPLDLEAIETDLRAARAFGPASPVARLVVETHAPAVIAEVRQLRAAVFEETPLWRRCRICQAAAHVPGGILLHAIWCGLYEDPT